MRIRKACIVGSGLMGSGIAQVCAAAGLEVIVYDIAAEALHFPVRTDRIPDARENSRPGLAEDPECHYPVRP